MVAELEEFNLFFECDVVRRQSYQPKKSYHSKKFQVWFHSFDSRAMKLFCLAMDFACIQGLLHQNDYLKELMIASNYRSNLTLCII